MRSRVVHVCASVIALLAIAIASRIGYWRAASDSPLIAVDEDQVLLRQNAITERVGDLPAILDEHDPWLRLHDSPIHTVEEVHRWARTEA